MKEFGEQGKEKLVQERLTPDSNRISSVALLYANVFAGWPWFEVSKGPVCQKFYGPDFKPGATCPCGCGTLKEAYPKEATITYINQELSKPLAYGETILFEDKPVGFGWGYELSGQEFAETKYRLPESRNMIQELIGKDNIYFYISEVGIIPDMQENGLGTRITTSLVDTGSSRGLPLLMRTNASSPMVKIAQKSGMLAIIGPKLEFVDQENPERIVFRKT